MTNVDKRHAITSKLIGEIKEALESVKFGSIEIFIQNSVVTQITVRNIRKTSVEIENNDSSENYNNDSKKKIILKNKAHQMTDLS